MANIVQYVEIMCPFTIETTKKWWNAKMIINECQTKTNCRRKPQLLRLYMESTKLQARGSQHIYSGWSKVLHQPLCQSVYFISTAQKNGLILMKISTNDLKEICKFFSLFVFLISKMMTSWWSYWIFLHFSNSALSWSHLCFDFFFKIADKVKNCVPIFTGKK